MDTSAEVLQIWMPENIYDILLSEVTCRQPTFYSMLQKFVFIIFYISITISSTYLTTYLKIQQLFSPNKWINLEVY